MNDYGLQIYKPTTTAIILDKEGRTIGERTTNDRTESLGASSLHGNDLSYIQLE